MTHSVLFIRDEANREITFWIETGSKTNFQEVAIHYSFVVLIININRLILK